MFLNHIIYLFFKIFYNKYLFPLKTFCLTTDGNRNPPCAYDEILEYDLKPEIISEDILLKFDARVSKN
jgi:hypothetical protein